MIYSKKWCLVFFVSLVLAGCSGTPGITDGESICDQCETCDDDATNDCTQDCAGEWGGTATVDECGTCDDDPANDGSLDCAGTCGGSATIDECGTCDDDATNDCTQDCAEAWGGMASVDGCGVCDSDATNDNSTCEYFDNLNGTITDVGRDITWMKCAQGMTFDADSNTCLGNETTFRYCSEIDNSCNGGVSGDELDGGGSSFLWDTCNDLEFAGYTDWRVPTKVELVSLVVCDDGPLGYPARNWCGLGNATAPTVDAEFFPNFPSAWLWSSTSYVVDPAYAWEFYFAGGYFAFGGGDNTDSLKAGWSAAQCVR